MAFCLEVDEQSTDSKQKLLDRSTAFFLEASNKEAIERSSNSFFVIRSLIDLKTKGR